MDWKILIKKGRKRTNRKVGTQLFFFFFLTFPYFIFLLFLICCSRSPALPTKKFSTNLIDFFIKKNWPKDSNKKGRKMTNVNVGTQYFLYFFSYFPIFYFLYFLICCSRSPALPTTKCSINCLIFFIKKNWSEDFKKNKKIN